MNEVCYDGLVLAGGRARRFGRDKRIEEFDGETFVKRAARKLAAAGASTVYIATGERAEVLAGATGLRAIRDDPPGCGPLGGISAALRQASAGVLVLAADLPLIRIATLRAVARLGVDRGRPVALRSARGWEPLVAYYPCTVLNDVRAAIDQGEYAPHRLLSRMGALSVEPVFEAETTNVNTPEDMASALRSARTVGDE